MVISIILDTEYMGVPERNKWFLKCVSNAQKEDTIIVTHSYFRDHLREVVEDCADRFYEEFEINRVPVEIIENMNICYIPDEWFDSIYEKAGSRSKQLVYLYNNNLDYIENYIEEYVDAVLREYGLEKPLCIFNSLHVFEFVRSLAKHYNCPIIPWVFSAVRKVHGYSQTLYMAHLDDNLFNSSACEELYNKALEEKTAFKQFNKSQIIALLGKKHNMPLLPLVEMTGVYEAGVVGEGYHITPQIYQKDNVTDDDLYYECKRLFSAKSIISRQHPMQLDQIGIGRKHIKNDPLAFILSCKRIVTVQSQMIIKAAIWNRAPVAMSNALPYACLLNREIKDAKPIDDFRLSFILFAYFIPDSCMFSTDYWKWRMTDPPVAEIVEKHISAIFEGLSIPLDIINADMSLERILESRGFSQEEIAHYLNPRQIKDVPLNYPTSCLKCEMADGSIKNLFCLNHEFEGMINSTFSIPVGCVKCEFIPQNDLDGYVSINEINIDGKTVCNKTEEKYYEKNQGAFFFSVDRAGKKQFDAQWKVKGFS